MTFRRSIFFLAVLALFVGVRPTPARAYTTISADINFYDDLSPYGSWVHVSRYGDCWQPYRRVRAWRPYTVGYWADTDYGWLWVSQDPWGDIPYHYGRWVFDSYYGWVWVPDDDLVWAPAWVSWRYSDAYVGWAPLPPEADWYGNGLSVNISFIDRSIPSSGWCFTPVRTFGTTSVRYSILPTTRNVTIFSETRNVTRYDSYRGFPVNRGPSPSLIQRATGRRIERYRISDVRSGRIGRPSIQGQTVQVYRPRITGAQRQRERFVPLGRGGQPRDASQRERGQQMRQDRGQRDTEMRQRGRDRARETEMRRQQDMQIREQQRRQDRGQGGGPPDRGQYRDRGQGGGSPDRGQYRDRGQGGRGGGGRDQGPPPNQSQGNRPDRGNQGGGQERQRGGDQGRGRGQDRGNNKDNKDKDQGDNGDQGNGGGQSDQQQDHGRGHGRGHGG